MLFPRTYLENMIYQELQNDDYRIIKRATFDVQGFSEGDTIKVFLHNNCQLIKHSKSGDKFKNLF